MGARQCDVGSGNLREYTQVFRPRRLISIDQHQFLAGEFAITRADGEPIRASGLSYDTKFNLAKRLYLYFNDDYFGVPPGAPHGQQPKLGVLHPSLMRRAAAAFSGSNRVP